MTLDVRWYHDINEWSRHTGGLHDVLSAYALWGGPALLAVLLVAGWLRARARPDAPLGVAVAALTGVATIVAVLVNQILISPAIARPRPCVAMPDAQVLLPCSADFSMPSDHTVIAGAFVAGLWLLDRRFGLVAGALALVLAFSRVYVGVHYPSDAVVGLLVGAGIALTVVLLLRGPATALTTRLASTPLRPLVLAPAPARPPERTGR